MLNELSTTHAKNNALRIPSLSKIQHLKGQNRRTLRATKEDSYQSYYSTFMLTKAEIYYKIQVLKRKRSPEQKPATNKKGKNMVRET